MRAVSYAAGSADHRSTMNTNAILHDAYGRITELVHIAADDLDAAGLAYRPEPDANSIAWLVWHLTRIQDHHLSQIADQDQAWVADGWAAKLAMRPDPENTGHGHTSDEVAAIRPADAVNLIGYHDAVAMRTHTYLDTVTPDELDRIVDRRWDPPVSVGVRLVSVISDNIQHAGQARYLRGIIDRLG